MALGDSSFPTGQQRTGIVNSPHEERACRGSESLLGEKHQKDASGLQVALGLEQWKAACHGKGHGAGLLGAEHAGQGPHSQHHKGNWK